MASVRGKIPRITWGGSFANSLIFAYPLDEAVAFSQPREGSQVIETPSGTRDAWIVAHDQLLSGVLRWIPGEDAVSPTRTGWDGATGVRAWLESARAQNVFRWIPDSTVLGTYYPMYLVAPQDGGTVYEVDFTRRIAITMRTSDGSVVVGY